MQKPQNIDINPIYFVCGGGAFGPDNLGCPKNALSSQTEKFIWATAFSHYLGLKHIRTTKILKIYAFFHPNQAVQSFTT